MAVIDRIHSPLRYPGSKSKVLKRFVPYFIPHQEYREPFLGSGSIFFGKPKVSFNWLNDKDHSIAAFFQIVRDEPEKLKERIRQCKPTIDLWKKMKASTPSTPLEIAFMFLFFNRTNFSGIIAANPIGGLQQSSKYKIDCRWNPDLLCRRIDDCSKKLQDTTITALDYQAIIEADGDDVFLILDPPYYTKGRQLYKEFMTMKEHQELSELLKVCKHPFLLTIDNCEETRKLYSWAHFINQEEWYYSITSQREHIGSELFISNFSLSDFAENRTAEMALLKKNTSLL